MADKMILKLQDIAARYEALSKEMSDPEVIADAQKWTEIAKAQAEISETAQKYLEYAEIEKQMNAAAEAEKTEADPEMKALFSEEVYGCRQKLEALREELKIMLLPKDKNDERNCIMEIRAGAGGDEAALFAYELYRMYLNYCERHRLKTELVDLNDTELGGIKEVVLNIGGRGAYKQLKFESGVHRDRSRASGSRGRGGGYTRRGRARGRLPFLGRGRAKGEQNGDGNPPYALPHGHSGHLPGRKKPA